MAARVRRRVGVWLAAGGAILSTAGGVDEARAQTLRAVPTDHWVYAVADELVLRHPELGQRLWYAVRPWREEDFRALLRAAEEAGLREGSGPEAEWLDRIAEVFPAER